MSARNFIVATAGHVDHGKSALVKALTGTDPDRLPEEKARGITLDLGFAELTLEHAGENLHVGIVDVPGHEDFVKNMIAGVGSIDLALIVVAADDGWMPQTEEHLQILNYLGVKNAVIALTKADLGNTAETIADARRQLTGTSLETAPIVETSVMTGRGLAQLRETLARQLSFLAIQRDQGKPRLFVDRVFSLRGIGTVVTGTLVGGKFERDLEVIVQPRGLRARIRTIQSHNREQEQIGPATRCALNLADVATEQIARGDVVTVPELGEPTSVSDVLLTRSTRPGNSARPLKNGALAYLHHGTTRVRARVTIAHDKDVDLAQVRLESPIFAFAGDRFVLRDPSERQTFAGGVILDVRTSRRKFREPAQREFLIARAQSPNDPIVAVRSELRRDSAKEDVDLLQQSNLSGEEISSAVAQLIATNELVRRGRIVAETTWWIRCRQRIVEAIEREHASHPQSPGLDLAKLRADLSDISSQVFEALIVDLVGDGYMTAGNLIKRAEHRAVLPPNLAAAADKIRHLLSQKPFDPPARKQVAPDPPGRQALKFLIEQRDVVEVGANLVLSREAFREMQRAVIDFISKRGPATVSELRQKLETSRRTLVPFLEKLDREHVTRRLGDRRSLGNCSDT